MDNIIVNQLCVSSNVRKAHGYLKRKCIRVKFFPFFQEQNLSLLSTIYYYTRQCTLANHYAGKVALGHEKNQDMLFVPKECQEVSTAVERCRWSS